MVARINFVKSLYQVLSYNDKKVYEARAELLIAAGFPRSKEQLTYLNKVHFFKKLICQNQRTNLNVVHLTLNFHPNDRLDKGLLIKIANEYLQSIGLGGQPYLVYQHYDAAHPHIHIVSTNIANGGKRIPVYDKGFKKSHSVVYQLENTYGLIRVQDHMKKKAPQLMPQQKVKLERIRYGTVETGAAIISIVSEVVKSYKFASLAALNEVLNQFGIIAYNGVEGGKMRDAGRLLYWVLKENGEKIGVAIRPRYIEGNPDLKNLEKRFAQNRISRGPQGQRLKNLLDKSLKITSSQEEMHRFLKDHGIRAIFRKDKEEKIIGVTYIDNATRTVYNGLELGPQYQALVFYSAMRAKPREKEASHGLPEINEKLPGSKMYPSERQMSDNMIESSSPAQTQSFPASELPAVQVLPDFHYFAYQPAMEKGLQLTRENRKIIQKDRGLGL